MVVKVKRVSNKRLNLAKQNSSAIDDVSNEPRSSGPVYADAELVRRAQKEDPWAIEQLVLRYQKKVYAIAYQMLSGDAEEARDRTQDAFLQAFRKIKQFRGKSSFYTWGYSSKVQHESAPVLVPDRIEDSLWKCEYLSKRNKKWQDLSPEE